MTSSEAASVLAISVASSIFIALMQLTLFLSAKDFRMSALSPTTTIALTLFKCGDNSWKSIPLSCPPHINITFFSNPDNALIVATGFVALESL